ncbi:hypothetical protein LY78DRAFT_662501 [Colletotrichum sublineola]|nr:hypothetical protein LY78DRAFT_662501 [Colletotrichum sublineola]
MSLAPFGFFLASFILHSIVCLTICFEVAVFLTWLAGSRSKVFLLLRPTNTTQGECMPSANRTLLLSRPKYPGTGNDAGV